MLDTYCFQRLHSGVVVGPDHAERSAAYDAAADSDDPSVSLTDDGPLGPS